MTAVELWGGDVGDDDVWSVSLAHPFHYPVNGPNIFAITEKSWFGWHSHYLSPGLRLELSRNLSVKPKCGFYPNIEPEPDAEV